MMFGDINIAPSSSQGRLFTLSHQPPGSEPLCQALLLPISRAHLLTPDPLPLAWPGCDLGTFFPSYQSWFLCHLSSPMRLCAQARGITDPAFLPLEQCVGGGGEEGFELSTSWKVARTRGQGQEQSDGSSSGAGGMGRVRGRACLQIQGWGLKQPGAAPGTWELELRGLDISGSGWRDHSCSDSHLSGEPGLWGDRAEASARVWGMTSQLELTEPNGALSSGPWDAKGLGPWRTPAQSPRDSLASEDLEMFVRDLEDCDPWESTRDQLSPMAGGPACHRLEDNPGMRRHLVKKPSRTQGGRGSPGGLAPILRRKKKKKKLDRRPHEVFVELNELMLDRSQEPHWRETARWIKFEEDVEEETERWGKPHVASLSFRSLLELRRTIAHGAALLDLEQTTLPGIAHLVVETMIVSDQIRPEDRASVLRTLLLKHSHPNDDKDSGFFPRNTSSSSVNSVMGNHHPTPSHGPDGAVPTMADDLGEPAPLWPHDPDAKEKPLHMSGGDSHRGKSLKLLEKIPEDAEATVVLVGCVPFLEQPAAAFVRLNEAVLLESVLEVPVPVRFLFVMLGPRHTSTDYHELGRSIATLMSDKLFHEAAYQADDRQDLLSAISEFLDGSIVIPPSEVEGRDLLRSVAAFQRELLRKRREREQNKVEMTTRGGYVAPGKGLSLELGGSEATPEDDPLRRTGSVFGGLVRDVKRRYPHYPSDLRDALHYQCVAAVLFIYFAALSPAITFGGLLGEKTEGLMGVSELIVSTAVLGVLFSLLGAQPLLVVGFSGPLLVFEEAFFKVTALPCCSPGITCSSPGPSAQFCQSHDLEYLTGRVWVGLWLVVFVLALVAAEGSFLVRYISPFTQEIFAFLISFIFIYETFYKLYKVFTEHPLLPFYPPEGALAPRLGLNGSALPATEGPPGPRNQPNTALLSLILMLGTFLIAFFLRKFRNSRFLGGKARRIIGDFGIPISILVMVLVDYSITDTYTQASEPDLSGSWFSPLGLSGS
ncbi:anion exchange protein 3 isoform X1 [Myotis daubentonii]|uniref:anion exchange protein 3 isoform X1 n=1 Tax=Myotis daubentonii TaxID=98922 RepID=UPI002872B910|nr:anion exchange protein 3 isoform X1 [Myotis daubentonii]